MENGAEVIIHDPQVSSQQIKKDLNINNFISGDDLFGSWQFPRDIYKSLENADAAIIVTEWSEYKNLDWYKISLNMRSPAWLFDTRSITNPQEVKKANINYWSIGNG